MLNPDRRFQKTEDSILDSLIVLLNRESFDALDLQDLTAAANINKSTFYLHYSSLKSAFLTLEDKTIATMSEIAVSASKDPSFLLSKISEIILDNKKLFFAVLNSAGSEYIDKIENVFLPLFGLSKSPLKPFKLDSGALKAVFAIDGSYGIYRSWTLTGCRLAKEKVEAQVLGFFQTIN
jgi:AcrR family transcriptional regulator